ncbi:hypothetical protein B0T21DRAFT_427711 [Apiosordaria backusii]|uniref:Ankyrin repeat protein n=1 Tax=Apiosordaria backusii TaxID=314023 RepID=A0AA40A6Z7_9PEZI|nr:hypothetical protein B0T21DRAFT_427711 [Apiosordaria backusii]
MKEVSESTIVAIIEDAVSLNQIGIMTRILSKDAKFLHLTCMSDCDRHEHFKPFALDDALQASARAGTVEMMECVIAAAQLARHNIKYKVDLLSLAIKSRNNDVAEVLLRHYPAFGEASDEVELRDGSSDSDNDDEEYMCFTTVTLFELTFSDGNAQVMEALVRAGARPDVRRQTLTAVFKKRGHMELITADNPKTRGALGRMKALKLPSLVLQYGLQLAIQRSSIHYAEFCVDKGANVNGKCLNVGAKRRRERPSMLFLAVKSGSGPIVKLLREHGANLQGDEVDDVESRDIPGKKRVEKHFSMPWEEIVVTYSGAL